MNQIFRQYLSSFKHTKILPTFGVDVLFLGIAFLILAGFNALVQQQSAALGGIQTADQLQQLLSNSPEQAQTILTALKSFVLAFLIGLAVVLALLLLLYSFSRAWIWSHILNQKLPLQNYWRWNLITLIMLIPLVIYSFIFLVFRDIFSFFFTFLPPGIVQQIPENIMEITLVLIFLFFIFLTHYSFTLRRKVFESLGNAFHYVKIHWSNLWKLFLMVLGTAIILNLLLILLQKFLYNYSALFVAVTILLLLLFFSWMRLYIVNTLQESSQHPSS